MSSISVDAPFALQAGVALTLSAVLNQSAIRIKNLTGYTLYVDAVGQADTSSYSIGPNAETELPVDVDIDLLCSTALPLGSVEVLRIITPNP